MICEHLNTCALLHQMSKSAPFTVNMVKIKYCNYDKSRCTRYNLSQFCNLEEIPETLWPSDEMRELELMELKLNETHKMLNG